MPRPRSCPHLLLVEDSDDDAFFFERILRKSGLPYRLTRQDNGTAALNFLAQCAAGAEDADCPDLIFLDLKLPGANGFEILQWLSANKLSRRYQIAVLSGSDQPVDLARAASLGASDYLVKPLRLEQLQSRLQAWAAAQPEPSASENLQP